ncbi:MAG: HD domain-containing protein [bacterium]|nr:HD domain-containing protein [bacterium]
MPLTCPRWWLNFGSMIGKEIFLRDTIHGVLTLDTNDPGERLLWDLVNTREFQRLRRIRQLGLTHLVYQGAEHTRFAHSIGVMHLTGSILDQLSKKVDITPEERVCTRVAALLHDIGHGPYSHVSEMVLGVSHEDWTRRIILDQSTDVNRVLREYGPNLPNEIVDCLSQQGKRRFLSSVISGQIDADRLDYLLRDSTMTGVKYGVFDLERLILGLEVCRDDNFDSVIVGVKGFHPTEAFLLARYHMYRQVYFHKTVWCAHAMLQALVRRARELLRRNLLIHAPEKHPFIRILQGEEMALDDYLMLDDAEWNVIIKIWRSEPDSLLADLSRRLIDRDLYKVRIFYQSANTDELVALRNLAWHHMRTKYGSDVDYRYLFEDATDIFYQQYDPSRLGSSGIQVRQRDGSIAEIDDVSPSIRALKKTYPMHMWAFPPEDLPVLSSYSVEDLADEEELPAADSMPEPSFWKHQS